MGSPTDSTYFPSLDKCLQQEELLISWKAVFAALLRHDDNDSKNELLESFFSDSHTQKLLAKPYDPFSFTQNNTKAAFDAKVSNVSPKAASKSPYNVDEIKEDALWLSKEVQIDEVSALRITVLEWQSRDAAELQTRFSNEEAVSLRAAAGEINTESSNLLSIALTTTSKAFNAQPANEQEKRRLRSVQLYLSERQNLLACSRIIFQSAFQKAEQPQEGHSGRVPWVQRVSEQFLASQREKSPERFLNYCIQSLKSIFENIDNGSGWFKSEGGREDVEAEWLQSRIAEATHILEISLIILDYRRETRSNANVIEWFRLMASYQFFEKFGHPEPEVQTLISAFQALVSVVSLSMLDCRNAIASIVDEVEASDEEEPVASYVSDTQTVTAVHEILFNSASELSMIASPAVLAWSLILLNMDAVVTQNREMQAHALEDSDGFRSSVGTGPEGGRFAESIESIMSAHQRENPIQVMASCALDVASVFDILSKLATTFGASSSANLRGVFDSRVRIMILDLIRASTQLVDYNSDAVTAVLAALNGSATPWDHKQAQSKNAAENPVAYFLEDDYMAEQFLTAAASRFPFESLPFLKFARAISTCDLWHENGVPAAVKLIDTRTSFTFTLPSDFRDYQTAHEEDNLNSVELTDDISLFKTRANRRLMYAGSRALSFEEQASAEFSISAGTAGRIITDKSPKVAMWFHEYSGLKYLGKLLETGISGAEFVDAITGVPASSEDMIEIISMLTNLLQTCVRMSDESGAVGDADGAAHKILELASDGLDRNRDIVSVVFSIFEEELERQATASGNDSDLELLTACMHFLCALVSVLPGRVWPLIGRSGLLDQDGRVGRITSIISNVELLRTTYDFSISCVHLFDALVEDSAVYAVLRKSGSDPGKDIANVEDLGTGLPDHVLSKSLASYTKTLLMLFEDACNWRFAIPEQRLLLAKSIPNVLNKVICYYYGVGDIPPQSSILVSALGASADLILNTFLSPTSGLLRFQPLFRGFLDGFATPDMTVQTKSLALWIDQVKSITSFTTTIIKAGALIERFDSQLATQLFKVSPLIARLYALHDEYKLPVVKLLDALVIYASSGNKEPPSLLGHLGQDTAKHFLSLLMKLGRPLGDEEHITAIWHLFSAVVSNRQQWFSIYLLTGKKPKDSLKKVDGQNTATSESTPLARIAFDELQRIQKLPLPQAVAVLEFVSLAQNFWPWALKDVSTSSSYMEALADYANGLKPLSASANEEQSIEAAYHARIAAYIAEIIAMQLYHDRQLGDTSQVKKLLPKLGYYKACAVSAPAYNSSLHGNLKKNLEARYPGCSLQCFKRTRLVERALGRGYFYNLDLADKVLRFRQAWRGKKGDGMTQELVKANINLSIVDTQISLLQGWKMLATELSNSLNGEADVKAAVVDLSINIAEKCLVANARSQLPENVFARLDQTRADFALNLLQKISQTNANTDGLKALLPFAWRAIVSVDTTFELALEAGAEAAIYYRTLLKILFLVLRVHVRDKNMSQKELRETHRDQIEATAPQLTIALEIMDKIIGQGFHDLASAIHAESEAIVPDDIALITALLQSCLLIPGIESRTSQIQAILTAHDTARKATSLFSWADRLAIEGDPIYGELSILFLLELSTIPEIAERLAVEGILGHLSSAPLTVYMRKANVGPLSESIGAQRCYSIWTRGMLPLLLNLLARLEGAIAGEIAIFLNQFPNLLQQAESALDMAERTLARSRHVTRISLLQVSEIQSIALIVLILKSCRTQVGGIPEVPFDSAGVLESVETWLSRRQVLSQRIIAFGTREAELEKRGELEPKIVEELEDLKAVLVEMNEGNGN